MILSFPTTFSESQWLTLHLIPALHAGCWTSSTLFFHPSAYTHETSIVSSDIISGSWNPGMMSLLTMEVSWVNAEGDRKSTRLNSSHQIISYAVFCLKKK